MKGLTKHSRKLYQDRLYNILHKKAKNYAYRPVYFSMTGTPYYGKPVNSFQQAELELKSIHLEIIGMSRFVKEYSFIDTVPLLNCTEYSWSCVIPVKNNE